MNPALLIVTAVSLLSSVGLVAETALPAETLLSKAKVQAAAGHKSIFLTFDASW